MPLLLLALALLAAPAPPPAAPQGDGVESPMICGVDWWLIEVGTGNSLPCPDDAIVTPAELPVRAWLPLVGR